MFKTTKCEVYKTRNLLSPPFTSSIFCPNALLRNRIQAHGDEYGISRHEFLEMTSNLQKETVDSLEMYVHFCTLYYEPTNAHNYFTNYHTATCFDTIMSSSDSL